MAAFVDQTSETASWQGDGPHNQAAPAAYDGYRPDSDGPQQTADSTDKKPGKPDAGTKAAGSSQRVSLLTRVVQAEILPRLALARSTAASATAAQPSTAKPVSSTAEDTAELVSLLLGRDADKAGSMIEALRLRGASPASLYLGLLSDSARMLGAMWDDDRCDFTQVTIGMGRLQQLVRALSPGFQLAAVSHPHPETILLLPAPGEHHTFGLVILSEFFQREGWHVSGGPASTAEDAADMARESWVDVAGFSIGAKSHLDSLTRIISQLRRVSRNRDISIMVGGPLILLHPELVARVGADVWARDAQTAVRQASGLLALRTAAD